MTGASITTPNSTPTLTIPITDPPARQDGPILGQADLTLSSVANSKHTESLLSCTRAATRAADIAAGNLRDVAITREMIVAIDSVIEAWTRILENIDRDSRGKADAPLLH
jgi:hypothetical protein